MELCNPLRLRFSPSQSKPCTHSILWFKRTHPTMHTFNILIGKNASNDAHIQYSYSK